VVGGSSPNSITIGSKYAYVSNATNDNISVIDYKKGRIIKHIPIKVDANLNKYRGLVPFGLTLSKDQNTLYVSLLGLNAIAVIDTHSGITKGLIPTGWGPTRVQLSDNELEMYIISCRGYGADLAYELKPLNEFHKTNAKKHLETLLGSGFILK